MRWAIISDIHANLQAFEAVLTDIAAQKVDRTICLGDAVGYGPQPAEVLTLLHAHVHHMIMGNHESAVIGRMDLAYFHRDARRMIEWTRTRLNRTAIRFLSDLPLEFAGPGFACVHGSFSAPDEFDYVDNEREALASFAARPEPLLFLGHTHAPAIFALAPDGGCARAVPEAFAREDGLRYIVNPGSVGLPRGDDFRASYCIVDTQTGEVAFNRVVYDTQLFRRQVERCSGDSEQVAFVLGLFDSHALPVLNRRVDFAARPETPAAATAKPAARIVIRKPSAAPATPADDAAAGRKPAARRPAAFVYGLLALALAAAAVGGLAWNHHHRLSAGAPVTAAAQGRGSAPPVTPAPPAHPPAPAVQPPTPPAAPAATAPAPAHPAGGAWKAVWKAGGAQDFLWDAEGNWNRAGFPDGTGAEALLDLGKKGIVTLNVRLGRDVTVGRLHVIEGANASVLWQPGHVLIFDNGPAPAEWHRNRGSPQAGALRLHVFTDLRLNSTLEAHWTVQRTIELDHRISGPGALILDHLPVDNQENNRQVRFRGGPNTYAGGTVLRGRGGSSRPSIFVAEKNGAFGTGDVTLDESAHLTLTDRGASDDMLPDSAALRLGAARGARPRVILNDGVEETVGALHFNGAAQASGTWGSGRSRAEHRNDDYFSGPGVLVVRPPPGPAQGGTP